MASKTSNNKEKEAGVSGNRIMLWICISFAALLTVTSILDRVGIKLLMAEFNLIGCLVLLVMLLGWGAWTLTKRMRKDITKKTARMACAFLLMLLGMTLTNRLLTYGALFYPQYRRTVTSPGGRNAVVLRQVDMGGETEETVEAMIDRMNARTENIEGAMEALEEEGYPRAAYGYIFTMYPKVLGLFYNANALSQGEIYLGVESKAMLHYDWISENELRVTIDDPEIGDEGGIELKF